MEMFEYSKRRVLFLKCIFVVILIAGIMTSNIEPAYAETATNSEENPYEVEVGKDGMIGKSFSMQHHCLWRR